MRTRTIGLLVALIIGVTNAVVASPAAADGGTATSSASGEAVTLPTYSTTSVYGWFINKPPAYCLYADVNGRQKLVGVGAAGFAASNHNRYAHEVAWVAARPVMKVNNDLVALDDWKGGYASDSRGFRFEGAGRWVSVHASIEWVGFEYRVWDYQRSRFGSSSFIKTNYYMYDRWYHTAGYGCT